MGDQWNFSRVLGICLSLKLWEQSTYNTRGQSRLKKSFFSCSRSSLFFFVFRFVFLFVLLRIKVSETFANIMMWFVFHNHTCKYSDVCSNGVLHQKGWIQCIKRARWHSLWISRKGSNIMPSEIFKCFYASEIFKCLKAWKTRYV